jgi:hypothetical protein
MKTLIKSILVAVPALVIAATVGLTMVGCGDDPAEPDLSTVKTQDLSVPQDLTAKKD